MVHVKTSEVEATLVSLIIGSLSFVW